jgi:putative MATE family efflux protein
LARPARAINVYRPMSEKSAWSILREAMRGGSHDFTEGSLDRAIVLLAIPMVMEMIMESIFAIVDVFWVAKLGADAVAAVGFTESLLALVYALAMGVAMAATATVARRVGEKRPEEAARAAAQSLVLTVLFSLPIAIASILYAPALLRVIGASPSVVALGTPYLAITLGSNVVILGLFVINAIFRGAGDAAVAMRVLWFANILNIVLGPLLIFGVGPFPKMGVTGAAVATAIGRGCGLLLQIYLLFFGRGRIAIRGRHFSPHRETLTTLGSIAWSGTLQSLIGTASWIGLVRILAPFGSAVLAGYTIGMRIVMFALLPSWGLSNAAATMVGQNLGAARPDRAEASVHRAGLWNTVVLTVIGILFVIAAGPICAPFAKDPEVHRWAASSLRITSYGFLFYGYGMVFGQAFNGAGDTWTPTWLNLACFWAFEIPLAWLLAKTWLGPSGVFASIAIAFSALTLVSAFVFKRGRWKTRKV